MGAGRQASGSQIGRQAGAGAGSAGRQLHGTQAAAVAVLTQPAPPAGCPACNDLAPPQPHPSRPSPGPAAARPLVPHLYSAPCRFFRISLSLERGWPPPPMQPPGQAMTSMKWYSLPPSCTDLSSFLALPAAAAGRAGRQARTGSRPAAAAQRSAGVDGGRRRRPGNATRGRLAACRPQHTARPAGRWTLTGKRGRPQPAPPPQAPAAPQQPIHLAAALPPSLLRPAARCPSLLRLAARCRPHPVRLPPRC